MEVKVRNIGNAVGVIFPKMVASSMDFHAGDVIKVEIHDHVLNIQKKTIDLKECILRGIRASEKDDVEFAESFTELDSEKW